MESNFQGIIPESDLGKKRKRPTEPEHARTAPKTPPSPEFLCQDCVNLDLAGALLAKDASDDFKPDESESRRRYWGYYSTWAVDVGHRYRVTRTTNCSLCQMLFKSRVDEGDNTIDGDGDWIRAVSYMKFSGLVPRWSDFWQSKDFPVLLLFSKKDYNILNNEKRVKDIIQLSGCATLRQLNQQQAAPVPLPLRVIPPVFDLGTFRDWFGYCKSNHKLLCRSKQSDLFGTRLVDCQEQSIVEHGPRMPYVALSYVWGQSGAQNGVIDGKQLPTQLPLLIRDAMAITKAMNFRYLWVDRYCIDQTNPTVVHQQIGQMGAIYGNAEVTIIAAAGQDEDYGLPGVGRNRATTRMVAHIGEVIVEWAPKDPQSIIK